MYACPTCGDGLEFDPKTQKLLCPSCRNRYEPEEIDKMRLEKAAEIGEKLDSENEFEAISYKCSHCGAELITTDETITTFCSFCRTGTMLERKIIKKRKPDYIIPFKITKKECEEIYINKIKKSIFAPKNMIDTQEVEKIRGIYMPYWIYSFEKHSTDNSRGSKYSHRSGDYIYYDDYSLYTTVDAECSGITHDATSNFYDRLSEAIAPYSVKEKKEFSPAYLSGYYADNEDVDDNAYLSDSEKIASNHLSKILGKEKEYHKYNAKPNIILDNKSAKLALFPVYFLATKNNKKDRISYAVINGQTGKIAADIPIDFKKFGFFSLILTVIIFMLLNLFLTISMPKLTVLSILFNIASIFILVKQNKKIVIRNEELDDVGVQLKKTFKTIDQIKKESKKEKDIKSNKFQMIFWFSFFIAAMVIMSILPIIIEFPSIFKFLGYLTVLIVSIIMVIRKIKYPEKDSSIYKPIYGLLLTLLVFCIRPASDVYYYAAALVSIAFTIGSFYDIIDKFNILTTRKLPQLGARGGDENA